MALVHVEEVSSSGNVRLSEKVVLVLLAIKAGAINEDSGFLPSRGVLGCAITVCVLSRCVLSKWVARSRGSSKLWRRQQALEE